MSAMGQWATSQKRTCAFSCCVRQSRVEVACYPDFLPCYALQDSMFGRLGISREMPILTGQIALHFRAKGLKFSNLACPCDSVTDTVVARGEPHESCRSAG